MSHFTLHPQKMLNTLSDAYYSAEKSHYNHSGSLVFKHYLIKHAIIFFFRLS